MKTTLTFVLPILFLLTGCAPDEITPQANKMARGQHLTLNSLAAAPAAFPYIISLPNGFGPEGITSGAGTHFYVGSISTGDIYKGSYRDGSGSTFIEGGENETALGLDYDERSDYLFVAGGFGTARVYNGTTGEHINSIQLNDQVFPGTIINDVIVTREAAFFTDSFQPVFYKVPLNKDGTLPDPVSVEEIPYSGDYVFIPGAINANGIVATPDDKYLIIGNLVDGNLYLVDPDTGESTLIDLMGESLPGADGLVLEGKKLFVVQNLQNQLAVVEMDPGFTSGTVSNIINDPEFKIPATAAAFGNSIYVVNARFDVAPPFEGPVNPAITFDIVRVSKNQ